MLNRIFIKKFIRKTVFLLGFLVLSAGFYSGCNKKCSCKWPQIQNKGKGQAKRLFLHGLAELKKDNFKRSLHFFNKSLVFDKNSALVYVGIGIACSGLEEYDDALYAFNNAVSLDSKLVEAFVRRGLVLHHQGKEKKALDDFNRALSLNPNHPLGLMGKAFVLYATKKYNAAFTEAKKAEKAGATLPKDFMGAIKSHL